MTELTARELLIMLYQTALDSVDGRYLVNRWCRDNKEKLSQPSSYTHCIAIGKVAAPMLQGALDAVPGIKKALLISPQSNITRQLRKNKSVVCLASSHPIPDESSLEAGSVLLQFVSQLDKSARILFLISGGASALVEVPVDGIDLDKLQEINRYLLSSGKDIHQINAWRQQFSRIKGGGLLNWVNTAPHTQLLLSDVKDDKPEFIGSGLLIEADTQLEKDEYLSSFSVTSDSRDEPRTASSVDTFIIGNINLAKQAVSKAVQSESLNSYVHDEFLDGDVFQVAKYLFSQLDKAEPGVHIWGGEPTVRLPEKPGIGGRNQTLALAFAKYITEIPDLHLLAAGTDGVDGNSNCAGAVVSMFTAQKAKKMGFDIDKELNKANAGVLLMATDDLIHATSHTNVMDIVIAYKVD